MAFGGGLEIKDKGRGTNSLGRWEASLCDGIFTFFLGNSKILFRTYGMKGELIGGGAEWMGDISSLVIVFSPSLFSSSFLETRK